ncbi:MAG: hypothetical protein ABI593_14670 [Betaproteobacteria bacterium]
MESGAQQRQELQTDLGAANVEIVASGEISMRTATVIGGGLVPFGIFVSFAR